MTVFTINSLSKSACVGDAVLYVATVGEYHKYPQPNRFSDKPCMSGTVLYTVTSHSDKYLQLAHLFDYPYMSSSLYHT